MKNTILKVGKFIISRALYFVAGIFIAIVISAVYAAVATWPAPQVSSGNPLTSGLWNTFAENLNDLNSRVNNFVDTDTHGTCWISGYNNCESKHTNFIDMIYCPGNKVVRGESFSSMLCCDIILSCD